jgi:hypothetical protein
MPRRSRTTLIAKGRCRSITGRPNDDLPADEQYAHLDRQPHQPARRNRHARHGGE